MGELILSPEAQDDLDSIYDYLAENSFNGARHFAQEFDRIFRLLSQSPYLGRSSDYGSNLRRFSVHPYVVFYRPTGNGIEIVRVLHGRQNMSAILRGEIL